LHQRQHTEVIPLGNYQLTKDLQPHGLLSLRQEVAAHLNSNHAHHVQNVFSIGYQLFP
jgi:hypothetical protein